MGYSPLIEHRVRRQSEGRGLLYPAHDVRSHELQDHERQDSSGTPYSLCQGPAQFSWLFVHTRPYPQVRVR